jgi:TPR repeat protein
MRGIRLAVVCGVVAGCASRIYAPYESGFDADSDERACDAGNTKACNRLGNAADSGWGVPADDERCEALFTRACRLGDQDGCVNLAVHVQSHVPPIEGGPRRAIALFRTACEHDNGSGCLFLAYAYDGLRDGIAARDPLRAHSLFERACALGESSGCTGAGIDFLEGRSGFPKDPARAIPLYQRACDLNNGDACLSLSGFYDQGIGVTEDKARGKRLFDRACRIIDEHEPCVAF